MLLLWFLVGVTIHLLVAVHDVDGERVGLVAALFGIVLLLSILT